MLSRAMRVPRAALPLRARAAVAPQSFAMGARAVTTNAASSQLSHSVPEVGDCLFAWMVGALMATVACKLLSSN